VTTEHDIMHTHESWHFVCLSYLFGNVSKKANNLFVHVRFVHCIHVYEMNSQMLSEEKKVKGFII